jgi:hypothetical protein
MRITAIAVAALLAAALCGCASQSEQLADASASGVAAVRSSALALELDADGRAWRPASDTVLADALGELGDATRSTLDLVPGDARQEKARDRVADELQRAVRTVAAARVALAQGGDLDSWIAKLDEAADVLEKAAS